MHIVPQSATAFDVHCRAGVVRVHLHDGVLTYATMDGTGLAVAAARIFDMTVDGHQPYWLHWQVEPLAINAHGAGEIRIELTAETALRGTLTLCVYPDMPVVRMWGALTNTGHHACQIRQCAPVSLRIDQAPLYLFHVDQFSWPYRRDFFTQHQTQVWPGRTPVEIRMGSYPSHYDAPTSCAWVAVRPPPHDVDPRMPHEGPGLVMGFEFNGKSRVYASATPTQTTIVNQIDALAHTLAPGASFHVPGAFIGHFQGDWDEAGYVTQRFAERYLSPALPAPEYPWVQYNSWKYGQEINETQQLAVIDQCAALGIEVFVLDLGWARCIGDWHPDPAKFPRGLAPLAARARQHGMRFGVHVAIAQCAPHAPIAQEHPEWLISTYDDYFGAGMLCFGHDPCRDWIIAQLSRLITEEGIDYIIQDGEDIVKYCPSQQHTHAHGDSNYANSQMGIDVVIGTLRQRHPHVVFENCEDGGMMMTFKMVQLYHTSITVDNIATYATRQGIYGASYPFAPRYSVRYMEDVITPYTLRSSIFGGPLILMQRISDWDESERHVALQAIAEYKQYRTLIRDAKIIHVLPPLHNVDNRGWGWDAIQAVHANQQTSVLMVFRAMGSTAMQTIFPRGLAPEMTYHVHYKDAQTTEILTGAAVMQHGIALELPEFGSEIVEFAIVAEERGKS